jgi:Flp pilus assembly protein TadD
MRASRVTEPSCADVLRQAHGHYQSGQLKEAEALLRDAVAKHPGDSELRNLRGVVLAAMRRYVDALWSYRSALALDPNRSDTWTNLGNTLTTLKQYKSAIICHRRAIALSSRPDPLLHHNLGVSLCKADQHGEAIAAFTRALDIDPNYHHARWDRALSYLYLGDYRQGWADYEVRLVTGQVPKRSRPGNKWNGTPYRGKRLLLLAEQGFGDMLWVARYLPRVKALGGELIVECRRELVPLIASMGIADRLIARGDKLPDADLHCYICSLPGLFTTEIGAIPSAPYLCAPADRLAKFRPLFERAAGALKVGIVWSGSITFGNNRDRAHVLMRFLQSFAIPGIALYSLQKGPPERELAALPQGSPIIDLSPHIADFADTAAAVEQLDLVIMTDSAVAHLAGAMGKPVWLLLGQSSHWLWLLERTDTPWYPTLRLFRSNAGSDWDAVFDAVTAELMQLAQPQLPQHRQPSPAMTHARGSGQARQ